MRTFLFILFMMFTSVGFPQKETLIKSGNSTLCYKTFGEGTPILVINGGPGMNSEGFASIAESLSQMGYQAITYDQRGTGKSTVEKTDSKTITMDLMVQDIENLRNHLKIEKWIVFGHSFGGVLAAYYASKHPNPIEKLIFSSSGGINMKFTSYVSQRQKANLTEMQKDSLAYFQSKIDRGDTSLFTRKNRVKYLAHAYVFDETKAPIIAERLLQLNADVNTLVILDLFKIKFDCAQKFKSFQKPVLVLQGKNDIITVETATEIKNAFPNATLVLLDNCRHYGWLDAPEIYFKSIRSFLNG